MGKNLNIRKSYIKYGFWMKKEDVRWRYGKIF